MTTLLLAALLGVAPAQQTPGQRVAARALSGEFGKLAPWQRDGYTRLLRQPEARTLVLTAYWPAEGRQSQVDCRGRKLTRGAMASNRLPQGTFVYIPSWGRSFRVVDRGSRSNDRRAGSRGTWCDVWVSRSRDARGRCDWTATAAEVARP